NSRLLSATVIVVVKVDGVLVNVTHELHGEWRHFCLRIARSRSAIVSGRTKVALTQREGVSQAPRLNQTHESVVDRTVTVRVELTHDLAHHAGTLRKSLIGTVPAVIHRVDHAPVHRLQSVTHVRQCPP